MARSIADTLCSTRPGASTEADPRVRRRKARWARYQETGARPSALNARPRSHRTCKALTVSHCRPAVQGTSDPSNPLDVSDVPRAHPVAGRAARMRDPGRQLRATVQPQPAGPADPWSTLPRLAGSCVALTLGCPPVAATVVIDKPGITTVSRETPRTAEWAVKHFTTPTWGTGLRSNYRASAQLPGVGPPSSSGRGRCSSTCHTSLWRPAGQTELQFRQHPTPLLRQRVVRCAAPFLHSCVGREPLFEFVAVS